MRDLRAALEAALPRLVLSRSPELPKPCGFEFYACHDVTRFDHDWEIAHAINSNPSVDGHSRAPLADVRHIPRRDHTADREYRRQFKRRFALK